MYIHLKLNVPIGLKLTNTCPKYSFTYTEEHNETTVRYNVKRQLILTGQQIVARGNWLEIAEACYGVLSVWFKEPKIMTIFGSEEPWILSALTQGKQTFEDMYLIHFKPSNNLKVSALRLMQEAHTLAQLEKQSLSPLCAVLSSLLWNEQSKGSETSYFYRASGIPAKSLPKT